MPPSIAHIDVDQTASYFKTGDRTASSTATGGSLGGTGQAAHTDLPSNTSLLLAMLAKAAVQQQWCQHVQCEQSNTFTRAMAAGCVELVLVASQSACSVWAFFKLLEEGDAARQLKKPEQASKIITSSWELGWLLPYHPAQYLPPEAAASLCLMVGLTV